MDIKNWSPIYHAQGTITQAVSDLNAEKCVCVCGGGGGGGERCRAMCIFMLHFISVLLQL